MTKYEINFCKAISNFATELAAQPKSSLDDARAKVELLYKAISEFSKAGECEFGAMVLASQMMKLASADVRRLEEQQFAALTVYELKARIDDLRKGA